MIGPSLPYVLMYGAMTKSPDGRGVLIFGGVTNENYMEVHETNWSPCWEDRILELRAGASSWNILNMTLENGRHAHVVIPLQ